MGKQVARNSETKEPFAELGLSKLISQKIVDILNTGIVSIRSALVYRGRSFTSAINANATEDYKVTNNDFPEGAASSGRSPGRGIDSYR